MKIAICDDEPLFIQQLQQMIQQLYPLPELMIDTFTAGEQLLDKIIRSQIAYQLILLDIEMVGDNGLHLPADYSRCTMKRGGIYYISPRICFGRLRSQRPSVSDKAGIAAKAAGSSANSRPDTAATKNNFAGSSRRNPSNQNTKSNLRGSSQSGFNFLSAGQTAHSAGNFVQI